jgi:hypothetical protein
MQHSNFASKPVRIEISKISDLALQMANDIVNLQIHMPSGLHPFNPSVAS